MKNKLLKSLIIAMVVMFWALNSAQADVPMGNAQCKHLKKNREKSSFIA